MVMTPDRSTRIALARSAAGRYGLAPDDALAPGVIGAIDPYALVRPSALLAKAEIPTDERGYSGTPAWGGSISGVDLDPVAAWQLPARWDTIDRMMTDPDIGAVLAALTLPILATPLNVEPASDDPFAIELADFVEAQLGGMTTSLAGHRFEVMRYLAWGARVFEIVMRGDAQAGYTLRKLALRPCKTVAYWHVDEHGGPDGITQALQSGGNERLGMDRLLMFVHQREGGDITGRSVLRDVYRPWLIIDDLVRVGVVAVERHGAGLPVLHYTGTSASEKDLYERAMMAIRAHTKGYLLLANGVADIGAFDIKGVSGTVLDPVPQIQWHQATIYRRMLAQFMLLGAGSDTGAFALSADQSGFFLQALRFVTGEVDDIYTRHLVPRLVGYNWAGVDAPLLPRVVHGALDRRDVGAWFANVVAGINAGVRFDRGALDAAANDMLGIPYAAPDDTAVPVDEEITPLTGIQITAALDIIARLAAGGLTRGQAEAALAGFLGLPSGLVDKLTEQPLLARRLLDPRADAIDVSLAAARPDRLESEVKLDALGIRVDFAAMTSRLDEGRDRIIKRVGALQDKQARMLGTTGAKIAKSGDPAKLASALSDPRKLIPIDEEAAALADELASLYDDGADDVLGEIADQGVKAAVVGGGRKGDDRAMLKALGYVAAALLADRMATAWAAEVGRQLRTGTPDAAAIAEAAGGASGKLLADLASQRANDAYAGGRGAAVEANADKIERVIYTAVIDQSTCQPCYDLDGNEYDLAEAPTIPNPTCEGGDRCRCQLIPVTS